VTGPTTVYVDAPGARNVKVYLRPLDAPYGGRPVGDARLVGSDTHSRDRFAIGWAAEEPYPYVELFAVASGPGDACVTRTSPPVTILLDWRHSPPPQGRP
jgi:hypothetical protein